MQRTGSPTPTRRKRGSLVVDLLAPDHRLNLAALWTVQGRTIQIEGGTQALQRVGTFEVHLPSGRFELVGIAICDGYILSQSE